MGRTTLNKSKQCVQACPKCIETSQVVKISTSAQMAEVSHFGHKASLNQPRCTCHAHMLKSSPLRFHFLSRLNMRVVGSRLEPKRLSTVFLHTNRNRKLCCGRLLVSNLVSSVLPVILSLLWACAQSAKVMLMDMTAVGLACLP